MSVKKKETATVTPGPAPKVVERPIAKDELISLQKEGKLVSYNPATGIGKVKSVGSKVNWPGGNPKVV